MWGSRSTDKRVSSRISEEALLIMADDRNWGPKRRWKVTEQLVEVLLSSSLTTGHGTRQ